MKLIRNILQPMLLAVLTVAAVLCPAGSVFPFASTDYFSPEFDLIFEHMTVDNGLPENSVRAMVQDRYGFVWLGTQNGLVRYDGDHMIVHTPTMGDSTSFGGRTIDALWEDSEGDIWIGTFLAGLWRYDGQLGTFSHISLSGSDKDESLHIHDIHQAGQGPIWVGTENGVASVDPGTGAVQWHQQVAPRDSSGNNLAINAILADNQGQVWCGTDGAGLARYETSTGTVRWYRHDSTDPESLAQNVIYDLLQDGSGRIWAATTAGLSLCRQAEDQFLNFLPFSDSPSSGKNLLISLAADKQGMLWIGAEAGLYIFDPVTWRFRLFSHDEKRPWSPVNGPVLSVMVDRASVVWSGSWHAGLNKADPTVAGFLNRKFSLKPEDEPNATVQAIHVDSRDQLWVGLGERPLGGGSGSLIVGQEFNGPFTPVPIFSATNRTMESVKSILETDDGTIIVGTFRGVWVVSEGVVRPVTEVVPGLPPIFSGAMVKDIKVDQDGRLWMATWSGLIRWDRNLSEVQIYRHDPTDPNSLPKDDTVFIHVDQSGRIWAGSDTHGLSLYRPQTDNFLNHFDPQRGLETVSDIQESPGGILWLASYAGLVRFDPATGLTQVFGRQDGLPNDQVASIVADDSGTLWVSTGFGLARFHPETHEVRRFDQRDGLVNQEIMFANAKGNDDHLYFGGAGGLMAFRPEFFTKSQFQAPVVITAIDVAEQPLQVGGDSPLAVLPHLARALELPHDRSDLAFSFAALDFSRPDQNQYLFRLEGVDEVWRNPGQTHKASYANLPSGRYTFQVRGSNRNGVWSQSPAELELRILPPWWRTLWAYILWISLGLLLIWVAFRQLTMRERMRARYAVQEAETRKLHEIDELKTRFLTNITHEFRTPLTLIKVPLLRLMAGQETQPQTRFATMIRNVDRLEQLIDQLLDLSRLEAGKLPLRWHQGDCISFLGILVSAFEALAAQRDIELNLDLDREPCLSWYEPDLLQKLVGNLLSNAVKHTPDGGRVTVSVATGPALEIEPPRMDKTSVSNPAIGARLLTVTVTNTGSYIDPEDYARVFNRFYQAGSTQGSGVGLALAKELTEWLGGTIQVVSNDQPETRFTTSVPVFLQHPGGQEAAAQAEELVSYEEEKPDQSESDDEDRVLVVEDHPELLSFMAADLGMGFRVLEAGDGETAFDLAVAEIPDLILSDVMMPGMDGFELCRRLKADERTSHIPIILLTALSETESRREGLLSGADDYLAKPFDAQDLHLRIQNLIDQRRKLAERYESKLSVLAPEFMPVTSADERLLVKLRKAIDANLDDPDFRIDSLCRQVGMSRSQLHRKLKALTGKSTTDFVRNRRLQRGRELLDGGYGNVTEVAYAVGFRNLSYFARSFRERFGVQPSDYLRQRVEAGETEIPEPDGADQLGDP